MNPITRQILEDVEKLPLQMQEEALDFVRSLTDKQRLLDLADPDREPNGTKLAKLMAEVAARGTAFRDIKDPAAWQREIRKDRPLPGREE